MTTVVAVRHGGVICLAADTMSIKGDQETTNEHLSNCPIICVGGSLLAIAGPSTKRLAVQHYFTNNPDHFQCGSVEEIYATWLLLHGGLRSDYFLIGTDDDDTSFESTGMDSIIANTSGAYVVSAYRSVYEILRYHSIGMGDEYALGAMHAMYVQGIHSASEIALAGIAAAAEFHIGTGLPAIVYTVDLKDG